MSNIKKIAAVVSVIAIVVLIYTISTFRNSNIPTSGSPVSSMSVTSVSDSQFTESTYQPVTSKTTKSAAVSCVTTVPEVVSAGDNKGHVIVPFSKLPEHTPPERIKPVPVITPAHIEFKSIPLICLDTQPSEQTEEVIPDQEEFPVTEVPVTDTPTEANNPTTVITSSETQPSEVITTNIIDE